MKASKHSGFNIYGIFVLAAIVYCLTSCSEMTVKQDLDTEAVTLSQNTVNINSATAEELAGIPHIGPKLAGEIVAFRSKHGPFRRTEHLMLIRGIGDNRYRKIRPYVKTD